MQNWLWRLCILHLFLIIHKRCAIKFSESRQSDRSTKINVRLSVAIDLRVYGGTANSKIAGRIFIMQILWSFFWKNYKIKYFIDINLSFCDIKILLMKILKGIRILISTLSFLHDQSPVLLDFQFMAVSLK